MERYQSKREVAREMRKRYIETIVARQEMERE
jgi:hypothetical protein